MLLSRHLAVQSVTMHVAESVEVLNRVRTFVFVVLNVVQLEKLARIVRREHRSSPTATLPGARLHPATSELKATDHPITL